MLFFAQSYISVSETGLYYLQSRYYNPQWGRFINADGYAATGQGLTGNNMFAYCGNNPVGRKDVSGEFWGVIGAAIGGAIAGALIATVSHVVSSAINGTSISASSLFGAAATGAVSGTIGAIGGAIKGAAVVASIGVGIITGVSTAINTEGPIEQKIATGVTSGLVAAGGTYLGTKIPLAGDTAFSAGVTAFAGGLFVGAPTEIINVSAQKAISSAFNDETIGSRPLQQLKRGRLRNVLKEC